MGLVLTWRGWGLQGGEGSEKGGRGASGVVRLAWEMSGLHCTAKWNGALKKGVRETMPRCRPLFLSARSVHRRCVPRSIHKVLF